MPMTDRFHIIREPPTYSSNLLYGLPNLPEHINFLAFLGGVFCMRRSLFEAGQYKQDSKAKSVAKMSKALAKCSGWLFCLWLMNTRFTFSFRKRKMSRKFCCSFIGHRRRGYCHKNHSNFQAPVWAPCFKLQSPACEQIVGASGDWAPIRLHPCYRTGCFSSLETDHQNYDLESMKA